MVFGMLDVDRDRVFTDSSDGVFDGKID